MADAYVDLENGADVNDGLTWANAEKTMQAGLTTAGAAGRCFVQIDTNDVATTKDTAAASRTLNFPGTDLAAVALYGVKNGTTAEPPTDSDLVVRGTNSLPVFECTGAGNDITLDEVNANDAPVINVHGIRFDAVDGIIFGTRTGGFLSDCELDFVAVSGPLTLVKFVNCDLEFATTAAEIRTLSLMMLGGLLSGSTPTELFDSSGDLSADFHGVDCSIITGTILDLSSLERTFIRFHNCKMGTGFTRVSGTPNTIESFVELIGSSDETGLGSGEAVRDYAKEYYRGVILSETTIIRTGGANDGVAGFSFALTPNSGRTQESLNGLDTPWFGGIIEGDASTSKDFTVYIANDSGGDLTGADVWLELLSPSAAGVTQHDFDISSRAVIDASAANVADDTDSDWSTGAGGKNAQKIIITATPDFTGPVYGRVIFAQAGTTTCYVDPKVYVTDT